MSDPIVEPALATLAGQIADLRGLLEAVLEGQRTTNERVSALENAREKIEDAKLEPLAIERPLHAGREEFMPRSLRSLLDDTLRAPSEMDDKVERIETYIKEEVASLRAADQGHSSAETVYYHAPTIERDPQDVLNSTLPQQDEDNPWYRQDGPHPMNVPRDLLRAGHNVTGLDRMEVPVRASIHDAHDRGITGVIIGDQAPFTHKLRRFDVTHVYQFLRHVEEYHHNYGVQVNIVSFIDNNILDAILKGKEHGQDLPAKISAWTPNHLRTAMCRYFATFRYTARDLCGVALEVVPFPQVHVTGKPTLAKKAIAQLAQVPVYAAALRRFKIFVETYCLLDKGWPVEKNPRWQQPRRLNEVFEAALKTHAPQAYLVLADDIYLFRRVGIYALLSAIPEISTAKIADLQRADESMEMLEPGSYHDADRIPGQGKPWLKAGSTSDTARAANFVPAAKQSSHFTPRRLNALEVQEEEREEQTWYDTQSTYADREEAEEIEEEGQEQPEDLNAIVATSHDQVDRSKQACHGFFFNPGGCMYLDKGKQCPYSHDPLIGQRVIDAAIINLKRLAK